MYTLKIKKQSCFLNQEWIRFNFLMKGETSKMNLQKTNAILELKANAEIRVKKLRVLLKISKHF